MTNKNIKILDCTLRDGGYYNNWDFDRTIVDRYLISVKSSSVDVVELGFRSLPKNTFMGPYIYTTDDFINQLKLPEGPIYGVMINGKEFIENQNGEQSFINQLFQEKKNSHISLVRIAINFNHVLKAEKIARELKDLGYMIGLNMMQAHGKDEKDYIETAKTISSWDLVDVLYFADSLGNMLPEDVKNISQSLKKGWPGALGIHTHNNKNLALINSITAVENGVTWCDGTITGMGRGAGNVSTESLVMEMNRNGKHAGDATLLQESVEDFNQYKNKYNWGPNIYYHFASNNNIHPTFVQTLLSDVRYKKHQVLDILKNLCSKEVQFLTGQPISQSDYSVEALNAAQTSIYNNNGQNSPTGTWDATGWLADREVLIIGAGPNTKHYNEGIINYIEINKPAVLELNINKSIPVSLVTASVVSLEARAIFDVLQYEQLDHPIVLPMTRLGKLIDKYVENLEIFNYGLAVKPDTFEFHPTDCKLHLPYTICYALAIASQAGAKMISLVGFDGYTSDDPRQIEMNKIFDLYMKQKRSVPIVSLTPTTYRIPQSSIFAPTIN
jgi:4-hydroxy 2-oxovalerate aldolase